MPDNVPITAGNGTTIATDGSTGVHYQRGKLTAGAEGNTNPIDGHQISGDAQSLAALWALLVESAGLLFNGATFDFARNNVDTNTGVSGAKTASFNGPAQTNFDARGAIITIVLGTVSGGTPTLAAQLQWSPDGGTTWLNYGPVLPNLTASSQVGTIIIYPTNLSTAGASPAALTVGSTVSVMSNAPLPRTWRLTYTIGGSTPSFAITGVYVNYLK